QYDSRAVLLRVQPDGTCILSQELEADAKVFLDMRRFPLDRHRLELVFRIFGYDAGQVVFRTQPGGATDEGALTEMPQWTLTGIKASTGTTKAVGSGGSGDASTFVVTLGVRRLPLFM